MAVTLTVNSVGYSFPSTGDQPPWGDGITNWASAVTTGMLQKAGGAFSLTADINFGASFGLISAYFTSRTASAASAGAVRLAKTDVINFRNNANSGNLSLGINGTDQLTFNSSLLITSTGVVAASKALVSDGSGNIISHASTTATQIGLLSSAASTIHGDTDAATLTNKTLTSPTINTPTLNGSGGALTLPAGPDTLVGRATTDTLTNKTIAAGSNTISGLVASNFSNQSANTVLAGPSSGSAAAPTFRALTTNDIFGVVGRNFLLNADGGLWQRGTSTSPTNGIGSYQADRFYAWNSLGASGVLTYSQVAATLAQSLFGFKVIASIAPTTAVNFGINFAQSLDNATSMRLYNQTASLSMQIKAQGNVNQVTIAVGYVTSEAKHGITSGLPTTLIASQTVSVNTSTFTLGQLANVAMGTSVTTSGSYFVVCYASGVSSGHVSDTNNGFVVEQPVLNLGSTCAAFATTTANPGEELALCQRYYERNFIGAFGTAPTTTTVRLYYTFKATKRASPTISQLSGTNLTGILDEVGVNGSITPSSFSGGSATVNYTQLAFSMGSSTTQFAPWGLNTDIFQADAEI